jgi:hypothetical protein
MQGFQGGRARIPAWRTRRRGRLLPAFAIAIACAGLGPFAGAAMAPRPSVSTRGPTTTPTRVPDPKLLLRQVKAVGPRVVLDSVRADQWPLMLKKIETGAAPWLELAVALNGTGDADLSGSLTLAVGVALANAPRKVLSVLGDGMPVEAVCGFPDMSDPRTNSQQKVVQYLDARARAVRKLYGTQGKQVREDCLAVLDRRRRDVLSPDGPFSH